MTETTKRQYILKPASLKIDFLILNLAESMIDDLLPTYRSRRIESKFTNGEVLVDAEIQNNKLILPEDFSKEDDFYKYLVFETLEGDIRAIVSSQGNELTTYTTGLNIGTEKVKIYQLGKVPMKMHTKENKKFIPTQIREASLWQAKYLNENQDLLNSPILESQTEGVSSASYTLANSETAKSQLYSPVAKSLISSLEFYQTI